MAAIGIHRKVDVNGGDSSLLPNLNAILLYIYRHVFFSILVKTACNSDNPYYKEVLALLS